LNNFVADSLCSLKPDHQLKAGWLLDRDVGDFGTAEELNELPAAACAVLR
jgi:hypothetical protein